MWDEPFSPPITTGTSTLLTLGDARSYVLSLSRKELSQPLWQHVAEALLLAADGVEKVVEVRELIVKAIRASSYDTYSARSAE